ncbi:BH3 interacting domain death agonist isoform 2-T2 [Clarias gariepinus]|uniref:BH3 interacting domain death agonist isoform X2 n=1 Tax=Clarias gariepinus TaxID=13013 RepID=UPI00234C96AE|nr:BH3 interacting domain death agonist isoform X2 [Clarias gariepinus]
MNVSRECKGKRMMDVHQFSQTPLLFMAFLQQGPCLNSELQRELENLQYELKHCAPQSGLTNHIVYTQDHDVDSDIECDGELQTDGHSFHRVLLHDDPQVDLVLPVPVEEVHAVREVAAELIRMADEFNQTLVAQAAERLTKNLTNSSQKCWWSCLSCGVDCLLKDMPAVQNERMVMALTFSLVRAVCGHAPRLLRDLCNTMRQYSMSRPR